MAFIESGKTFDKEADYEKSKKRLTNMDSIKYLLSIPSDWHKKVKIKAAQDGITLKSLLLKAIEKYINI